MIETLKIKLLDGMHAYNEWECALEIPIDYSLDELHQPLLMRDMDKAVKRILDAIQNQERILIFGDYDVDGTTSVTMMFHFLSQFSDHICYYIPDRYAEGYGVSELGIEKAEQLGFDHKVWDEGGASSHYEDFDNRPVLLQLLSEIKQGNVKHLWVYNNEPNLVQD